MHTVRSLTAAEATPTLVGQLGGLLAGRHRAHRLVSPLLDPSLEEPGAAARQVAELLTQEGASGAIAFDGDTPVGFLVGVPANAAVWGPSVWIPAAGAVAPDVETVRDLYAVAAQPWVDAGHVAHYALVPASDSVLVEGLFRSSFGLQHVHAAREPAPAGPIPDGVTVRRAVRADVPVLARLERELPQHHGRSPVFASGHVPTEAEALQEWEDDFDDERFTTFVAEVGGQVVGSAVGCALEVSSAHTGLALLDHAGFLGFAAVLPQARGHGAGRALGEAVIGWSHEQGFRSVVTDWRATNLLASRTWPRLGFEPTFVRLHRVVGH